MCINIISSPHTRGPVGMIKVPFGGTNKSAKGSLKRQAIRRHEEHHTVDKNLLLCNVQPWSYGFSKSGIKPLYKNDFINIFWPDVVFCRIELNFFIEKLKTFSTKFEKDRLLDIKLSFNRKAAFATIMFWQSLVWREIQQFSKSRCLENSPLLFQTICSKSTVINL